MFEKQRLLLGPACELGAYKRDIKVNSKTVLNKHSANGM